MSHGLAQLVETTPGLCRFVRLLCGFVCCRLARREWYAIAEHVKLAE